MLVEIVIAGRKGEETEHPCQLPEAGVSLRQCNMSNETVKSLDAQVNKSTANKAQYEARTAYIILTLSFTVDLAILLSSRDGGKFILRQIAA